MPIYEYKCSECGNVFEHLSFRSDSEDSVQCPSCGGEEAHKILSTFSSGSPALGGGLSGLSASSSCGSSGGFS